MLNNGLASTSPETLRVIYPLGTMATHLMLIVITLMMIALFTVKMHSHLIYSSYKIFFRQNMLEYVPDVACLHIFIYLQV